jgi:two-component system OmpR family sensor kinase
VSLRLRLLIGVVVVSFVGLLAADVVTLGLVRSSSLTRIDDRLVTLSDPAQHRLVDSRLRADYEDTTTNRFGRASGYFAEIQGPDGQPLDRTEPAPTANPAPLPDLPTVPTSPAVAAPEPFTVGSVGDPSFEWRVRAVPVGDSGSTLVVALPLTDVQDTIRTLLLIEVIATVAVLTAISGLGWWVVNLGLRPLRKMEETAESIADGDMSQRVEPAGGKTEIGRLGTALNSMLTQIEDGSGQREASEQRLRQFVADASHELRTPVTAIRGYAELYEQGLLSGDDLGRAMGRIKSEAFRMSKLTEDLLLLAHLDHQQPTRRQLVDLSALAEAATADARAIEPDRPLTFSCTDGPIMVLGDQHQLHQVIANLLANIRDHTPADTAAGVEVHTSGTTAVVTVSDSGPGIPVELGAEAFERFRRADRSRTRGNGGAGLGLSIVAAIVGTHGGSVQLSAGPQGGAVVTVRLALAHPSGPPPAVDEVAAIRPSGVDDVPTPAPPAPSAAPVPVVGTVEELSPR